MKKCDRCKKDVKKQKLINVGSGGRKPQKWCMRCVEKHAHFTESAIYG